MNAVEVEAALSEPALQPFDTAELAFQFPATFGSKDLSACAQNMPPIREVHFPATRATRGKPA